MWKQKYKNRSRGFTLIELLVTIGIIGILAGIGVVTVGKIRATTQQTKCVSNLRGISQGLQLYYNDHMSFPEDGYPDDANDLYPLSTDLASYINSKSTFVCPEDEDTTSTGNFASYDPYYVARKTSYGENELAIGCPRHRGGNNSTSLLSTGSTEITKIGTVLANGQEVPPDGTTSQRTINSVNDVMEFDDGSTVTVINASGGSYGCFLIQSVRLADGTLYSIVKVQDNGSIDVQVTSGSKFEIVTPSAIVGVRGTEFTVTTSSNGTMAGYQTDVWLDTGTVTVLDRETGGTTLLTDGGTTIVATGDTALHSHYHAHADGTWHSHEHPSLNNAHHGKHIPGTEGVEEEEEDNDSDGYTVAQGDCDDTDPDEYPGQTWYSDVDNDNYSDGATVAQCERPVGYKTASELTASSGDCDDNDSNVNPGMSEITDNGIDDDCDPYTLDNGKIRICHKPGTPAEQTKDVNPSALAGHLGHGDYIGECP